MPILHAWGMTETSPVATVASPRTQDDGWTTTHGQTRGPGRVSRYRSWSCD